MNDGGKGSRPRPFSVSNEEYANRWDAIFGRDIKTTEYIQDTCSHGVWTHDGLSYVCLDCGLKSDKIFVNEKTI